MKKVSIAIVAIVTSFIASADYLYWTVGTGSEAQNYSYTYATLYATTASSAKEAVGASSTYQLWSGSAGTVNWISTDVSSYQTGYSYYIALEDDSADVAYSSLLTYSTSSSYFHDVLTDNPTATAIWTGGTYSAPEPSSALLLLLGLAGLGLKRKNA